MTALILLAEQLESEARTKVAQAKALRELAEQPVQAPAKSNRTLSIAQVAELMSVSDWFVRKLISRGELPAVRLSGAAVRVAESDVAALIRRRSA